MVKTFEEMVQRELGSLVFQILVLQNEIEKLKEKLNTAQDGVKPASEQ